eukprot:13522-Pleurochrysis_carterae.AAC.1
MWCVSAASQKQPTAHRMPAHSAAAAVGAFGCSMCAALGLSWSRCVVRCGAHAARRRGCGSSLRVRGCSIGVRARGV